VKIFGLCGKAGAGKDSFFNELKLINPDCVRIAFADELKREIANLTGLTPEYIEQHKASLRGLLQHWGTDLRRRHFGEDYWIKRISIRQEDLHKPIFVTDVRFVNEANFIRDNGGKIIRIVKLNDTSQANHVSESEMDGIAADITIIAADRSALKLAAQKFAEENF
jgi:ABC-type branched-subunit amino acid transport system ATPase component